MKSAYRHTTLWLLESQLVAYVDAFMQALARLQEPRNNNVPPSSN